MPKRIIKTKDNKNIRNGLFQTQLQSNIFNLSSDLSSGFESELLSLSEFLQQKRCGIALNINIPVVKIINNHKNSF